MLRGRCVPAVPAAVHRCSQKGMFKINRMQMPRTIAPARRNNFDIVRLTLACMVAVSHLSGLSQVPALARIPDIVSARVAVEGFFAISGFLIVASYERCSSLKEYTANRAWRILPGYWFATIVCLMIAIFSRHFHFWKFLFWNLLFANFMHSTIQGLFDENQFTNAVNGALWTIKIEIMFYCVVPMIVWCYRKWNRDAVLVTLCLLSWIFRMVFKETKAGLQLPGQLSYFIVGALIFYHLPWFKRNGVWLMVAAAALHGVHLWTGWFVLRSVSVPMLTLGACQLLPHIEGPTRWGDFSYGTYLLHFPIIQGLVALHAFRFGTAAGLCIVFSTIAAAVAFSWFVVERPSLQHSRSRRLRRQAAHLDANYPPAVP